jgi:deoxyribonuclease II
MKRLRWAALIRAKTLRLCVIAAAAYIGGIQGGLSQTDAPVPLLEKGNHVDWWFVYKFNSSSFPGCGAPPQSHPDASKRVCLFGGTVKAYPTFGQQFVFASSKNGSLKKGFGCVGGTTTDPLGATFDQIYNGRYYYVIWNDQFYRHPQLKACGKSDSCGAPWGHSKGMLAWNEAGEGLVLQVTTPSWPAAGSKKFPRKDDGNTLGCIQNNNLKFAQHFFALRLIKEDLVIVLKALAHAGVVTDPDNPQLVRNGGPGDVQDLVEALGKRPGDTKVQPEDKKTEPVVKTQPANGNYTKDELSTKVILISKPPTLYVPPWQMVSAAMGGIALRTATWWGAPKIYTTKKTPGCWSAELEAPGPVQIATTGEWEEKAFKLVSSANHAKIGVSTSGGGRYSIFGDMNQQGAATGSNHQCEISQNGRGGLFFVVRNLALFESITDLIRGDTAPAQAYQH